MFVDDPRASVELAADLVDDSLEAFVASARQLQGSLRSSWGGSDADTEQLRKALQRYRASWRHLHNISIEP
jgi:sRNA-binding protein